MNYIDGSALQKDVLKITYDDCSPDEQEKMKELVSYISKQKYKHTLLYGNIVSQKNVTKRITENVYVLPEHRKAEQEISSLLQCRNCFLLIEGDKGIGKSYVIERVLNYYKETTPIISIDLSSDWSSQTLLVELSKEILQLDFLKVLSLLSEKDKQELSQQVGANSNKESDYLVALKQLLFFDTSETSNYNYLVRTFLKNILEKSKLTIILYLYNCNEITAQTSNFFLNFFPAVTNQIKVIIELDNPTFYFHKSNAMNFINCLHQYSQGEVCSKIYPMVEAKKDNVAEYVKKCLQVTCPESIADYICDRYGCNLQILSDVVDFINKNGIKTKAEINRMPLVEYGTFSGQLLEQYYRQMTAKEERAFNWIVCIMDLMYGRLNYELLTDVQIEFHIEEIRRLFIDMPFFVIEADSIIIKNITYKKILKERIGGPYQFEVIKFLLNHKDHWNLSDLQAKYKECCFRLTIKDNINLSQINELVTRFSVQNLGSQKSDLLFLCYQYFNDKEPESLNVLTFLIQYLESISEKLLYCNNENKKLLEKADQLCKQHISIMAKNVEINIYELQIRIYFIYYNQQKIKFRFNEAEKYIDKGLHLESYCQNVELIGKLYWCKSLCLKERGIKPGFLKFMRDGIHKYPSAMYLKVCYLSNYASSNFKVDLDKSYKALEVGIKLAKTEGLTDLEIWLSNNKIICDLTRKDFSIECLERIIAIKEKADKYELISDISRAYNNEGIWNFQKENTNEAICCLQHALNIFDETVTDQQKFLFRTNKITFLQKERMRIDEDLSILYDWLKNNYSIIVNKLEQTSTIEKENNYAAILSLYKSSYMAGANWFSEKLVEWFQYPAFDKIKENPEIAFTTNTNLIDKAFIVNNEICILF